MLVEQALSENENRWHVHGFAALVCARIIWQPPRPLLKRLQEGRQQRRPRSWQRLAREEGFAQRTLERFYMVATELEEHADKRPDWVLAGERDGRFIHAQATAMPLSRTLVPPDDPWLEHFVPPPLRRELTPSQLPLGEQAALFVWLQGARGRRPPRSWRYLAIEEGFAQRTLEHFCRSAMQLEKNADKRSAAQIFAELIEARSTAMPVGRRSGTGLDEFPNGERGPVERRRARTEGGRGARKVRSSAARSRSETLLNAERLAAEARDAERQQGHAQELLARAEEMLRDVAKERGSGADEAAELRRTHLRRLMEVWDPFWGSQPSSPSEA
jgi:hypothetical protein